jgi:hypothetical protein
VAEITKEGNYTGIRVKVPVRLGKITQRLQIDIGFGDALTPGPVTMSYPTLLEEEDISVLAYSRETLIAEKFEAMITLGVLNSRMKDFYDLYTILQEDKLDEQTLPSAIRATFTRRGTPCPPDHPLFTTAFAEEPSRNVQWRAFLKKARLDTTLTFPEVMAVITEKLGNIYQPQAGK